MLQRFIWRSRDITLGNGRSVKGLFLNFFEEFCCKFWILEIIYDSMNRGDLKLFRAFILLASKRSHGQILDALHLVEFTEFGLQVGKDVEVVWHFLLRFLLIFHQMGNKFITFYCKISVEL